MYNSSKIKTLTPNSLYKICSKCSNEQTILPKLHIHHNHFGHGSVHRIHKIGDDYLLSILFNFGSRLLSLKKLSEYKDRDIFSIQNMNNENYYKFKTKISNELKILPNFIDEYIYNSNGPIKAKYLPDALNFQNNLESNDEKILSYIGTYFPRSFIESYNIYNNILTNNIPFKEKLKNNEFKFLDIGSGTGGNCCGLLYALNNHNYKGHVTAICTDGNHQALNTQKKILESCLYKKLSFTVSFQDHIKTLDKNNYLFENDLYNTINSLRAKFDIIMAWKTLSEYYHEQPSNLNKIYNKNIYHKFMRSVENFISEEGICVILDVTCKPSSEDKNEYLPVIISNEIKNYYNSKSKQLKIISPASCSLWLNHCREKNCFKQKIFNISCSQKKEFTSKTIYYIFTKIKKNSHISTHNDTSYTYSLNTNNNAFCKNGFLIKQNLLGKEASTFLY